MSADVAPPNAALNFPRGDPATLVITADDTIPDTLTCWVQPWGSAPSDIEDATITPTRDVVDDTVTFAFTGEHTATLTRKHRLVLRDTATSTTWASCTLTSSIDGDPDSSLTLDFVNATVGINFSIATFIGAGTGGGAVDSVNGQTGVVELDAGDVGAATAAQGATADTALQPGDLNYNSETGLIGESHIPGSIARDTEVTAAADTRIPKTAAGNDLDLVHRAFTIEGQPVYGGISPADFITANDIATGSDLTTKMDRGEVVTTDSPYNADGTESLILTAGSELVLVDPAEVYGQIVSVVAAGGDVTITAAGGATILGQPSFTLFGGGNSVTFSAADATVFAIGPTWTVVGVSGSQFSLPDFSSAAADDVLTRGSGSSPEWATPDAPALDDYTPTADLGAAAFLNVGSSAGQVAAGDAAPNTHASTHADGGTDEIAIDASQITTGTISDSRLRARTYTNLLMSGRYTRTANRTADATVTNNRLYYVPIMIDETVTFDRAAIMHAATTAGASSVVRIGIYANTTGNLPGTLLLDCGSVDLTTAAALKPLTINQQLTRGLWWLGAVAQITSGSPTFAAAPPFVQVPAPDNTHSGTLFEAGVIGSLPTTATPGSSVTTQPPVLYLRVA